MKNISPRVTLWVNRCIFFVLVALLPAMPFLLRWYSTVRLLTAPESLAILIAFYICAVITGVALWKMEQLLRNILRDEVFIRKNVRHIRCIQWCCCLVSLVCLPASFFYLPLIFMVVIMAFLCLVVSVVVKTMDAAVAIREENDLTI